jgi:YD repeat-containing protein
VPAEECTRFNYDPLGRLTSEVTGTDNRTQSFEELINSFIYPPEDSGTPRATHSVEFTSAEGKKTTYFAQSVERDARWKVPGVNMRHTRPDGTVDRMFTADHEMSFVERSDGRNPKPKHSFPLWLMKVKTMVKHRPAGQYRRNANRVGRTR